MNVNTSIIQDVSFAMRYARKPDETIRRLPVYLRALMEIGESGAQSISSGKLADFLGIAPYLIRKDFSYFGGFGTRGKGYEIEVLIKQIRKILRLDVINKAVLVGFGNLGRALLAYPGFKSFGFEITALFDSAADKIGQKNNNLVIRDIADLADIKGQGIRIAIIAVPGKAAQQISDELISLGVKSILNFAPCHLNVPKKVKVVSINIAADLAVLPYYMSEK